MSNAPQVAVEMLVAMASEKNDRDVGAVVNVPADEADRLIERGFAIAAGEATAAKPKRGRPAAAKAEE
jgi:hypothetical protein